MWGKFSGRKNSMHKRLRGVHLVLLEPGEGCLPRDELKNGEETGQEKEYESFLGPLLHVLMAGARGTFKTIGICLPPLEDFMRRHRPWAGGAPGHSPRPSWASLLVPDRAVAVGTPSPFRQSSGRLHRCTGMLCSPSQVLRSLTFSVKTRGPRKPVEHFTNFCGVHPQLSRRKALNSHWALSGLL